MRKLLPAFALVAAVGCASLGRQAFSPPRVTFQEMRLNGFGLTGGSLDVMLNVENPNNFRLDATQMTYRLLIDSVQFGTGTIQQNLSVEEKGMAQVRIPVSFTYAGIGSAGRALLNTGTVPYTVTGDLTVATPLGNFTRPYSMTGTYSILQGSQSR